MNRSRFGFRQTQKPSARKDNAATTTVPVLKIPPKAKCDLHVAKDLKAPLSKPAIVVPEPSKCPEETSSSAPDSRQRETLGDRFKTVKSISQQVGLVILKFLDR